MALIIIFEKYANANNATDYKIYTEKQKLLIFSMKFHGMPFSETITFLCEMQVHIALWCWIAWVNSRHAETTVYTSEYNTEFSDIKKQYQVCYLKEKNSIEFTHAVQHHNAM